MSVACPDLSRLRHIVLDVDGTLTDGSIYYDNAGNELKKFCTRDGAGLFAARQVGLRLIVLTGRESAAVKRRMEEFHVDVLEQHVADKAKWLRASLAQGGIDREEMAFIGDELNDLAAMRLVGFVGCPQDACTEVKALAHYISPLKGGEGAVRDVIAFILRARGQWDEAVRQVYHIE
jgi:3-deoxy-D-manno-octulosonate 8-phosphate phosphatase (KDO 8-P phosphatase)